MSERFEIRLAPERRQELAALAAEIGMSASDLARLAIYRLLKGDAPLPSPPPRHERTGSGDE
jgi:hypothetical protein